MNVLPVRKSLQKRLDRDASAQILLEKERLNRRSLSMQSLRRRGPPDVVGRTPATSKFKPKYRHPARENKYARVTSADLAAVAKDGLIINGVHIK